jgi:transglutaminase-like putative cysteine protease
MVMEPVGLDVFFLAPVPLKINGDYRVIEITPDGSVFNSHPAAGESDTPQAIGVYSADADTRDPEPFVRDSKSRNYPERVSLLYLQLPRLDSRIPVLAQRITAASNSNYARAKAIEQYLQTNFSYTLQLPGVREPDPLAYFLFERKKGHCEYFASSMAIMLRTQGIPARVVNGFRGGEYNDLTGSYIVREKDAHSWVEAYFPEYGWVTFDPTPSGPAAGDGGSLSRMALYLDAMREIWREWVINYDLSHQMRLSAELSTRTGNAQSSFRLWLWQRYRQLVGHIDDGQRRLERLSPTDMVVCCVSLFLLLALPLSVKAWRSVRRKKLLRNPQLAPSTTASFWYLRMLKFMARRGLRKEPAQTAAEFTSSIDDLQMRQEVETFTAHYERARFAESVEDAQRLPELYEELAGRK